MRIIRSALFLFAIVFFAFLSIGAQTPRPTATPKIDDDVIKIDSRLVVVPVSVLDANGEPVIGLKAADFQVFEDGKNATIDQLSTAENAPLEIALLVDVSGSVNPLFDFEIKAAAQFLETVMRSEDHATIFLIGDQPVSVLTRETSTQAAARVRTITLSGKFTAFYDTVSAAAKYLQKNAPVKTRRVILALTDGEDNWSEMTRKAEQATYTGIDLNNLTQAKRDDLASRTDAAHKAAQARILRDLQDADTVFYSINPSGASVTLNKISRRAQIGLETFANDTGGTSFVPRFLPTSGKDALQNASNARKNEEALTKLFRQLAGELRAQYLIQYYSESDFALGRYVKLNVALPSKAALRVRARQGYYVKNN
jgi:Ca-activated chloride channel family protein